MGDCSVLAGCAEVLRGDGLVSNGAKPEAQRNFLSSSRRSSATATRRRPAWNTG